MNNNLLKEKGKVFVHEKHTRDITMLKAYEI
jgi:hypothetical protein